MFKSQKSKIWAAIIFLYVCWGSTYLALRFVVRELPPFFFAGSRNLLAGLILFVLAILSGQTSKLKPKVLVRLGIIGALFFLGGNGLITLTSKWVPSGYISIFPAVIPIWLVLIEWVVNKKKPNKLVSLGVIMGLLGVINLANQNQFSISGFEDKFSLGLVCLILATISWAIGVFLSINWKIEGSTMEKSAWQMIIGGGLLTLVSFLINENGRANILTMTQQGYISILYLIFIGSIAGFWVFTWVSTKASPMLVGTYNYVNPIVAIFMGHQFANEPIASSLLLSVALVFVAVFLISKK